MRGHIHGMNRHLRRLQQFGKSWSERRSQSSVKPNPVPPPDPRAKSTGHGKVTADKWNQ
jgi:hypothetical protein